MGFFSSLRSVVKFFRLRPTPAGITAKIVADSIASYVIEGRMQTGVRITTYALRYPRFIHAELMTHRVFSRNASSSRAIPVLTMLKEILFDPAMPVYWGANQSGMQAKAELTGWRRRLAIRAWRLARYPAVAAAYLAYKIGLHKQIANRICEPWAHITVLVSATEYRNWFALRLHEDAQPEIRRLATAMWQAREMSAPTRLQPGQWHLPFVHPYERELDLNEQIKLSVARCARVSYLTHDKKEPQFAQDIKLYERLVGSVPLHASPAEHQATPDTIDILGPIQPVLLQEWKHSSPTYDNPQLHGNFVGWVQYRKTLPFEFDAG